MGGELDDLPTRPAGVFYRIVPGTTQREQASIPNREGNGGLLPGGQFHLIGKISSAARPPKEGDHLLIANGKSIAILPRGSMKKPFEWVAGYVAEGKNTYIAAIRSLIAVFFQRRQADRGSVYIFSDNEEVMRNG